MHTSLSRPEAGKVKITDAFWSNYLIKIRNSTLPYVISQFEKTGSVNNFALAAGLGSGNFQGNPFQDGLLLETIRGACEFLSCEYDKELDEKLDEIIDVIGKASKASDDGYLCTSTTLRYPTRRFGENGGDIVIQHDLYNQGALIEAGIAHYLATKKTTLLIPAVRAANNIVNVIPDKGIIPGHSLPEEAFVKLYRLFCDRPELEGLAKEYGVCAEKYLNVAEFWYDGRGKKQETDRFTFAYHQNHLPFRQQMTAEGHAVRAALCYTGACSVIREADREDLIPAVSAIWENIVKRKMHISGGIGTRHDIEGFDVDYNLPEDAYLETCAAIALAFFAGEMNTILPYSEQFDVFERAMHNNILAAIGGDGKHFFYQNPLISNGGIKRWEWHGCPCCPPMLLKFYGSLGSYVYSFNDNEIYINLLLDSEYSSDKFSISINNGYINFKSRDEMMLKLRIPEYAENFQINLKGNLFDYKTENGYALIPKSNECTLSFKYSAPPRTVKTDPRVLQTYGKVAVMHGPWLMCAEEADNPSGLDFKFTPETKLIPDGDGVICVTPDRGSLKMIPYYLWAERDNSGKMKVWF